jgi:stress response protein YsnF
MRAGDTDPASVVLSLHREDLSLTRRTVETGRVQISTTVKEREELVDQLLKTGGYEIERVGIGQRVSSPVPVREEGDTIILPVVEECSWSKSTSCSKRKSASAASLPRSVIRRW